MKYKNKMFLKIFILLTIAFCIDADATDEPDVSTKTSLKLSDFDSNESFSTTSNPDQPTDLAVAPINPDTTQLQTVSVPNDPITTTASSTDVATDSATQSPTDSGTTPCPCPCNKTSDPPTALNDPNITSVNSLGLILNDPNTTSPSDLPTIPSGKLNDSSTTSDPPDNPVTVAAAPNKTSNPSACATPVPNPDERSWSPNKPNDPTTSPPLDPTASISDDSNTISQFDPPSPGPYDPNTNSPASPSVPTTSPIQPVDSNSISSSDPPEPAPNTTSNPPRTQNDPITTLDPSTVPPAPTLPSTSATASVPVQPDPTTTDATSELISNPDKPKPVDPSTIIDSNQETTVTLNLSPSTTEKSPDPTTTVRSSDDDLGIFTTELSSDSSTKPVSNPIDLIGSSSHSVTSKPQQTEDTTNSSTSTIGFDTFTTVPVVVVNDPNTSRTPSTPIPEPSNPNSITTETKPFDPESNPSNPNSIPTEPNSTPAEPISIPTEYSTINTQDIGSSKPDVTSEIPSFPISPNNSKPSLPEKTPPTSTPTSTTTAKPMILLEPIYVVEELYDKPQRRDFEKDKIENRIFKTCTYKFIFPKVALFYGEVMFKFFIRAFDPMSEFVNGKFKIHLPGQNELTTCKIYRTLDKIRGIPNCRALPRMSRQIKRPSEIIDIRRESIWIDPFKDD